MWGDGSSPAHPPVSDAIEPGVRGPPRGADTETADVIELERSAQNGRWGGGTALSA